MRYLWLLVARACYVIRFSKDKVNSIHVLNLGTIHMNGLFLIALQRKIQTWNFCREISTYNCKSLKIVFENWETAGKTGRIRGAMYSLHSNFFCRLEIFTIISINISFMSDTIIHFQLLIYLTLGNISYRRYYYAYS